MDIRLNLALAIDEAATMNVLLSEDGSDHLEIEGGGDLNFSYDPITGNRLFGRYTVLSGKLDYSLVVASLKDFKLHTGSYIEFLGDPLNPTLSLAASQLKKASVTEGKVTRSVNFDVGLKVTRNLKDLGLEFTIEAPEDLTCQQELSAMSTEQRGRVAVTLLATGMYVTDTRARSTPLRARRSRRWTSASAWATRPTPPAPLRPTTTSPSPSASGATASRSSWAARSPAATR